MKNLKKVLALVVALTMVLGTVAFAGYTDVAEDAEEYTAVSTLSSLGILTGYEDGSFKPDGDITRAEFCAVVCRAMGASVSGSSATNFTDVAADHWASGYISYLSGQKIVNGKGDNLFDPEANVKYEEAVKMLVVALGFEPMALQKGGYPTGYMVIANTYGMTDAINVADQAAPASRKVIAQLTYNALDIPMMEQTGFGSQTEYTIQDGTNNKDYKTLLTNLDVAKLDGIVDATPRYNDSLAKDQIMFEITDAYKNADYLNNNGELKYDDAQAFTLAEGVEANDYFGVAATVFVKKLSNSKKEIIAIMPGAECEMKTVAFEDMDVKATVESDNTEIVYFPSASSTKTSKYKLDSDVAFYYNYNEVDGLSDIFDEDNTNRDIEITLINNDGDNDYDKVVCKEYDYDIVDEVEADRDRFSGKNNDFSFDFDDEEVEISITNANGDAITLADLAKDNVIAYIVDGGVDGGRPVAGNYDWIEIINLGESAITGTIDETTDDSLYIDGTEYILVSDDNVNLGDEGKFYLTQTNKIFAVDKTASASSNYGYILNASKSTSGFTDAYQVKMLTKENTIVIYTLKDGVKIDGESFKADGTYSGSKTEAPEFFLEAIADGEFEAKDDVANRLVTYKLDTNGLIREFRTAAAGDYTVSEQDTAEYKADAQKLGKALEDDTIIFNISSSREDSATKTDISFLVDEAEYDYYIVKNYNDEYDCVIITKGGSLVDYSKPVAIVKSATKITLEDGTTDAVKAYYYTEANADLAEVIIANDDAVSEPVDGTSYEDVKAGAIMMFTASADGVATAYSVLGWGAMDNDNDTNPYTLNEDAVKAYVQGNDKDNGIIGGYIEKWDNKTGKKVFTVNLIDNYACNYEGDLINGEDVIDLTVATNAYGYTFNTRNASKFDVVSGNWAGTNSVDKMLADSDEATYFLAFTNDGTVVDFITFHARKDTTKVTDAQITIE